MTNWKYYPSNQKIPSSLRMIVDVFEKKHDEIKSSEHTYESNQVLEKLALDLEEIGFQVEKSKRRDDKIYIPVLYGEQGRIVKAFEADAFWHEEKIVLEVEAGRGVTNYQFLKDLFQACVMDGVDYLAIAIRKIYRTKSSTSEDYSKVINFFDAIYSSNRLNLPLKGILILGY